MHKYNQAVSFRFFTCSHSSSSLSFILQFFFLSAIIAHSLKSDLGLLLCASRCLSETLCASCCLSEAWWHGELPSLAWSEEPTIGPLEPSQSLCQAGPIPRWYFKSGHQSTLLGPCIPLKPSILSFWHVSCSTRRA